MIAICPNPFRDIGLNITRQAVDILRSAGFETAVCPVFAEDEPGIVPADIPVRALADVAPQSTLIVVVGGDGTILSVVRSLKCSVPVLGINLGTKGFMASLEADDLPLIVKAAKNEAAVSRRMKLDVQLVRGDAVIYEDCALNDAVIHGYGDCIKLTAICEGDNITDFLGDGIILSTPTGSTGYSMSAGGPIVEPDAENIIITPICAHAMGARSFVLAPSRAVTVKTQRLHGRRAYLSVDGNPVFDMQNDDMLVVRRSRECALMVNMGLKSFYDIAYEKLI